MADCWENRRFFPAPPSGPPARSAVRPPRAVDGWSDRARQAPSDELFAAANGQHGRAAGGPDSRIRTPMARGEAERGEVLHLCARQRRRCSCAMPGRDCCTAARHFDTSPDSLRADSHVSTRALDACARKQACRPQLVEWSRRAARGRCWTSHLIEIQRAARRRRRSGRAEGRDRRPPRAAAGGRHGGVGALRA